MTKNFYLFRCLITFKPTSNNCSLKNVSNLVDKGVYGFTYVVENLNPNTKYEFRVKAIISNKEGEFSDVITAKTSDRSDHGLHESDFHINLRWVINRVCKRYHD